MNKTLYLTIDDFPTRTSEEMLLFLKEQNIPCVIFCIGSTLAQQQELGVKALSMGFILGNHSYTHKAFSKLSLKAAFKEIEKTDLLLQQIYSKAGVAWEQKYFRFPYGDKGDGMMGQIFTRGQDPRKRLKKRKIQRKLADLGYTNLDVPGITYSYYKDFLTKERDAHWTFDVMEWCLTRPEGLFQIREKADVVERLFTENPFDCRGAVPEQAYGLRYTASNEVVLLHDCEQTFDTFKIVLTELLRRGCQFGQFNLPALPATGIPAHTQMLSSY